MTFINNSYFNNSYISNLDNDEKIVLFYLANNPLTNFTGICNINLKDISVSLKIENELISNIISKFQNDNILIFEDKFSTVIFLENEFWDFRKNLNQKTKTHLKKKIQSLPNEIKQMISDKNIDNLGQYVEYESAEVVVMELMQILHKIDENKLISDTLSTHLFNSVKNAIQRYENKRLNNINLINGTVYTNNINIIKKEKKVYTGNKLNSNNTLSTPETISPKTEIYDPNKKRVGRPRKIKDGYLHITKVYVNDKGEKVVSGTDMVEKTDYNGKKLFGLRKKDYISKVDKDKVNIDEVKSIFRENVAKYELTGRQLLITDKIANEYFDKRTSQQWRMSRTLKYDIMRWIVSNKVLKGIILENKNQILKYELSSEIDNKFNNHFNEKVEVNSGNYNNSNSICRSGNISGNIDLLRNSSPKSLSDGTEIITRRVATGETIFKNGNGTGKYDCFGSNENNFTEQHRGINGSVNSTGKNSTGRNAETYTNNNGRSTTPKACDNRHIKGGNGDSSKSDNGKSSNQYDGNREKPQSRNGKTIIRYKGQYQHQPRQFNKFSENDFTPTIENEFEKKESEQERENKRLAKDSIEMMEQLDKDRKATYLNIIQIQRPEIYKLITNQ